MSGNRRNNAPPVRRRRARETPPLTDEATHEGVTEANGGPDLSSGFKPDHSGGFEIDDLGGFRDDDSSGFEPGEDSEAEIPSSDLPSQLAFDNPDDAELVPEGESVAAVEDVPTQVVLDNPDDGDLYRVGREPGVGGRSSDDGRRRGGKARK